MFWKDKSVLFHAERVRAFGEVFFGIFGSGKDSDFSKIHLHHPTFMSDIVMIKMSGTLLCV